MDYVFPRAVEMTDCAFRFHHEFEYGTAPLYQAQKMVRFDRSLLVGPMGDRSRGPVFGWLRTNCHHPFSHDIDRAKNMANMVIFADADDAMLCYMRFSG